jgi:predicted flavoprotein YhiN
MIAVVGGGPAGLRAAEVAASTGAAVTLFEGKPSVGRKFLVAGKGGLNLTHEEPLVEFEQRYLGSGVAQGFWAGLLAEFGPGELRMWAAELGCETFVATSGRVYPRELKAAALLRAWVGRLRGMGVQFRVRHRLADLEQVHHGPLASMSMVSAGPSPRMRSCWHSAGAPGRRLGRMAGGFLCCMDSASRSLHSCLQTAAGKSPGAPSC